MKTSFALCCLLPVLATCNLSAAIIVSQASEPISEVIMTNPGTPGGGFQVRNQPPTDNRWVGVGFKALSSSLLDRVSFQISSVGAGAANASMSILILSMSSLSSTPPTFPALQTETHTLPATLTAGNWITFDLDTPFQLAQDSLYGILIRFDTAASSRTMNLVTASGAPGAAGIGQNFSTLDSGSNWSYNNPWDFVLQTTVPEPGTSGLLLASLALLSGRRGRGEDRTERAVSIRIAPRKKRRRRFSF
jgi:hypothetical protein